MAARRAAPAAPNTMAAKRIRREISDLARENLGDITLTPNESNIFLWRASIPGPQGSPYEGGVFDVDIRIPDNYPFAPPQLQFLTKVYHCNINQNGAICLDLLKSTWSPALSLYKVILSLSSLLTDPNPGDPLVPAIANEYRSHRAKHDATAREWVKLYAQPKDESSAPAKPTAPPAPSSSRPRPIRRVINGTNSPPAPIAGTRRSAPSGGGEGADSQSAITVVSDDDDDDGEVEVVSGGGRAEPRRKRARVEENGGDGGTGIGTPGEGNASNNAAGASHDVIVIDD